MKHLARRSRSLRRAARRARAGADSAAAGDFRHRRSHRVRCAGPGADRWRRHLGGQDRARGVGRQQCGDGQGAAGAEGRGHRREGLPDLAAVAAAAICAPPNRAGPNAITGYRASNRVTIKLRDVTKVASVIDTLVGAGANEIGGINFVVSQASKALDEAREKAIADARRKAEIYAKAAGVTLGEPHQHFRRRRARRRRCSAASGRPDGHHGAGGAGRRDAVGDGQRVLGDQADAVSFHRRPCEAGTHNHSTLVCEWSSAPHSGHGADRLLRRG